MFILISSNDLFLSHVGIELQSLCLYVTVLGRGLSAQSGTAALKHLIVGAYASAPIVFGVSLVYGATGTTPIYKLGILLSHIPDGLDVVMVG